MGTVGRSACQGEPWRSVPQGFCVTWKPASFYDVLMLPGSITLPRARALVLEQERGWTPAEKESSCSQMTPRASGGRGWWLRQGPGTKELWVPLEAMATYWCSRPAALRRNSSLASGTAASWLMSPEKMLFHSELTQCLPDRL